MTDWQSSMELWEHQGRALTAGCLNLGDEQDADVPVLVALYDGGGERRLYTPAEIGYVGIGDRPDAVVITVVPQSL